MASSVESLRNYCHTFWTYIINYFPRYNFVEDGNIGIDERPHWATTFLFGVQHLLAMFGGTVLVPRLAGFDPNTSLFFSGIGTLVFYIITGGKVPSFLGSSFAFLGVVQSATNYTPGSEGVNPEIGIALGGIIVCGLAYAAVAIVVIFIGYEWIEVMMPPIVTGSIIMAIGLNLSSVAIFDASKTIDSPWQAVVTLFVVAMVTVFAPGIFQRLPVLIGLSIGFIISIIVGLITRDPEREISFSKFNNASWIGVPNFYTPVFDGRAISVITPIVVILVAENLGHVKSISAITQTELLPHLGRAFLGDAIATILSGCGGALGLTTYCENIGVMAVTRVYSTIIFVIAAFFAILLGFIPKFGALVATIPHGVFGGLSIILFGLVSSTGARIWIENEVDFSDSVNLIIASVTLVIGAGMTNGKVIRLGPLQFDGIGTATIAAILLHIIFRKIPSFIKDRYHQLRNDYLIPDDDDDDEENELSEKMKLISKQHDTKHDIKQDLK